MIIKIDCKILSEQIQLLDMYSSVMTNEHNRGLVEGVVNVLSEISFALEEGEEINFVRHEG